MDLEQRDTIDRAILELAKDLLDMRGRYQAHDSDLAAAFSSKADEICRDFGLDRALIESSLTNHPSNISVKGIPSVDLPDPDVEDDISDQTLHDILGKQRKVVGDQFLETTLEAKSE